MLSVKHFVIEASKGHLRNDSQAIWYPKTSNLSVILAHQSRAHRSRVKEIVSTLPGFSSIASHPSRYIGNTTLFHPLVSLIEFVYGQTPETSRNSYLLILNIINFILLDLLSFLHSLLDCFNSSLSCPDK